jgi:hypothetical protein
LLGLEYVTDSGFIFQYQMYSTQLSDEVLLEAIIIVIGKTALCELYNLPYLPDL